MKNLLKIALTLSLAMIASATGNAKADVAASTTRIIDGQAVAIAGDCQGRGEVDVRLYKLDAPSSRDGMPFWPGLDASLCYGVWPGHALTAGNEVEPITDSPTTLVTGMSAGLVLSAGLVDHKVMSDGIGGAGLYLRWEDRQWQAQFEGTIGGELRGRPTDWDFTVSLLAMKKLDDKLRLGAGLTYQLLLNKDAQSEELANAHDFGGFARLGIESGSLTVAFDGGAANVVKWRRGEERFDGFGWFGRAQLDIRFKRF